jgi:Xaa-Pro aminopeptidase
MTVAWGALPPLPVRRRPCGAVGVAKAYAARRPAARASLSGYEWPHVRCSNSYFYGPFDHALEPGKVLCSEALATRGGGEFGTKLEEQLLITKTVQENLTRHPFDAALTAAV